MRIKITVFVLQGLVTGFAGVMLASRMSLGGPKTSVGLELGGILLLAVLFDQYRRSKRVA
jgi:L-arabinose transport system permease protein